MAKPLPAATGQLASRLNVMVWNIEKAKNLGWDTDLAILGAASDLILIQEASVQAGIETVLPQALYGAFAAGYADKTLSSGVLTLSAVQPSLHCQLTSWEPWLGTPKATNVTEYPIQGTDERLLVINLHAVNFTVGVEDFEAQFRTLQPLLVNHSGPLILAGDFNTWSDDRYAVLQGFMREHQLTSIEFSPDHRTRVLDLPLDHVYVRNITPIKATSVAVDTSDHNPLFMTVELIGTTSNR